MKKTYTLLVLILLIISCETVNKNEFAIVIHGGAGTILKENMSNELETAYSCLLYTSPSPRDRG